MGRNKPTNEPEDGALEGLDLDEVFKEAEENERGLQKRMKVKEHGIVFDIGHDYNVLWERCDTPEKLLDWVCHLSEKEWMTLDLLKRFVETVGRRHEFNFRGLA